jgi:hypothetical protein
MPISNLSSDGINIACLLLSHEWSVRLSVSHRFAGNVTAGVSDREERRPEDEALRLGAAIHLQLPKADGDALRQRLATLGKTFVGVPLWMDALTIDAEGAVWPSRIYAAERLINLTTPAIVAKDAILTPGEVYAPLLVGHIDELPPITALDEENCELTFSLTEDSGWTFRVGINATDVPGVWPPSLVPDWFTSPVDQPLHGLEFLQIGEQRERSIEGEERPFRWEQTGEFWFKSRAEVRSILAFFVACEGPRQEFTAPVWFKPGEATAETPHSTKMRFKGDVLTLDYFDDADATARVELTQLPWEIAGVEGETPKQPARIFLYQFTYSLPVPVMWRFTNWPRPLVRPGDGTYAPAPIKHRETTGTLDLRGNELALDSFIFADNPLKLYHPDIREGRIWLQLLEVESDPINPATATVKWFGEIRSVKTTGRKLEASGLFIGQILERQLPNVILGESCNTRLFSRRCGLVRADYAKLGTLTSNAGLVLEIATAAVDAAGAFAFGDIEVGSGATWELRSIVNSVPIVGGQRITVDYPVRQAAVGQGVNFARGCDLKEATCKALGNFERNAGHPRRPKTNLSIPAQAAASAPGKK